MTIEAEVRPSRTAPPRAPQPRRPRGEGAGSGRATALWASLPADLAPVFRPHTDALTRVILTEIQRQVPEYARPLEGPFGQVIVRGVREAIGQCLDNLGNPAVSQENWIGVFRHLGRIEYSEGRPLDQIQTAYRVGGLAAWRFIAKLGQSLGLPADLLCVGAEAVLAYVDEISALSVQGYRAAQARAAGTRARQRRQLLGLVLSEPAPAPQAVQGLAGAAGWRVPEEVVAMALEPRRDQHRLTPPALPADVLADLESPQPCLLAAAPPEGLAALLRGWRVAVGPRVPLAQAAMSLRWARRTMDLSVRGILAPEPVLHADDHLTTLWMLADEFLISQLRDTCLAPLHGLTDKQRSRLGQTLLAWLQSSGSAPEMADRLGVHPQTVRYRMRRIEELFGDRLGDPDHRLRLEIALRAAELLT
ncbi:DNA-binding CsgD family transcriptional regulator [Amycolatopsis endophytica]|uniref:DNA-binding CsgD family transcriptional regulator n=1 Tax=Amycolatopsis endophytica TaxID=860233 RepID=A0A853BB53_9PSEU|nr:helix-turn-helix domain-containing protein [Amycolatopsis endophytica]NYI92608.1 DNA-binding CsgD family transcriptional regulator [Amycolatopsis endophytica]